MLGGLVETNTTPETLAKHLGKRLRPAAFDGSQERHPAIATGLTILDATDAN
jgi:hypothetical protein